MTKFYEKADETILDECKNFVQTNNGKVSDYYVYREALSLYVKLSQSLIDSHKEFDEAIKKETDSFIFLDAGPEKDCRIIQFNQAHYSLVLDQDVHSVLEQLEIIEKNNRRK